MKFEDLTPEQQEKAKKCKTPEELQALANEEGVELSEDDLQAISGGWGPCTPEGYGCGVVGR